jgi:hypothetical protein
MSLNLPKTVVSCRAVIIYGSLTVALGFKWNLTTACRKLELPEFPQLIRRFLCDQIYPHARIASSHVLIDAYYPVFVGKISIFHCASATFRAPSDPSGPRSMRREYIRATASWRIGRARNPDDETGLWMVEPDIEQDGQPHLAVIHLDSIFRAAHLIPAYRTSEFIRRTLRMHDTLDGFENFLCQ